jgi:hypothetical protein
MSNHNKSQQPIPSNKHNTAQKSEDSLWDDLEVLFRECSAQSIIPASIAPLLRNAELVKRLKDPQAFLNRVQILNRDIKEFSEKLTAIHAQHVGRSGNNTDSNELMKAIQIHELYLAWIDQYHTVVTPTVTEILDIGEAALNTPYEETVRGKLEVKIRERRERDTVEQAAGAADVIEGKRQDVNLVTTLSDEVLHIQPASDFDKEEVQMVGDLPDGDAELQDNDQTPNVND